MEIRESFVIHTEWIEDLPDEYKSQFLTYIYNYGSRGEEPEGLHGLELTMWIKIQRRLDEDQDKWATTKARRSMAGMRGAQKRWTKSEANKESTQCQYTNEQPEENKPKKTKKFVKPTVEEVTEYCEERNSTVDPQRFVNYYEANGWKVGRNTMKDWRAAVRNWESRQRERYGPDQEITEAMML